MLSVDDESPSNSTDETPGLIGFAVTLSFVTTVVVAARVWARKLIKQPLLLDDWLCLAALVFQHGLLAACFMAVIQGGVGRDMRTAATQNPNSARILYQVRAKIAHKRVYSEIDETANSPSLQQTLPTGLALRSSKCLSWLSIAASSRPEQ
jgi:hypothetical protein